MTIGSYYPTKFEAINIIWHKCRNNNYDHVKTSFYNTTHTCRPLTQIASLERRREKNEFLSNIFKAVISSRLNIFQEFFRLNDGNGMRRRPWWHDRLLERGEKEIDRLTQRKNSERSDKFRNNDNVHILNPLFWTFMDKRG